MFKTPHISAKCDAKYGFNKASHTLGDREIFLTSTLHQKLTEKLGFKREKKTKNKKKILALNGKACGFNVEKLKKKEKKCDNRTKQSTISLKQSDLS